MGISWLWLVIVVFFTWALGAGYYPYEVKGIAPLASYALGLASVLLLFASILAHEFGHALVARRRGVEVEEIDLWLLGGVARMRGHPRSARDELSYALAGPAVTAAVAFLFGGLALALPSATSAELRALISYEAEVNLLILGFNLVPAFPLDGGRVARALLWRHSGDLGKATEVAAGLGRAFGWILVAGGVLLTFEGAADGLWLAVIGVFVIMAAGAERAEERVIAAFTGVTAADLMTYPVISIPSELTLGEAQRYFARERHPAFPVTDRQGRAIGILSIAELGRASSSSRRDTPVDQLATHDPALLISAGQDMVELLDRPAFQRVGRAVVVHQDGQPIGIVSVTDVERALRWSGPNGPGGSLRALGSTRSG